MHLSRPLKLCGGILVAALFIATAVSVVSNTVPSANAAALSEVQIQSIIGLLSAFGGDAKLIQNVEISLRGGTPNISSEPSGETVATSSPAELTATPEPAISPAPTTSAATTSITISLAPGAPAQQAPLGTAYVLMANYSFDATFSSEDVTFSSVKFLYTDSALYDPYNCAIYSGAAEFMTRYKYSFNPDWVHPAGTGEYEFILTTPLVITKGTVRNVEIRCTTNTIAKNGTGSFSWGLSATADGKALFTGTGVESGTVITPKAIPGVGYTIIFVSQLESEKNFASVVKAVALWLSR